jgi:integrating conjugative element membrane protein (TIGR03745 family)
MNFLNPKLGRSGRSTRRLPSLLAASLLLGLSAGPALAALPTAVAPATGVVAGDYIAIMHQYWTSGVAFLVLLAGAWAFFAVGGGAIAKFNEYRLGKAEAGDLMIYAVIGVVILVAVVYLLTEASSIL